MIYNLDTVFTFGKYNGSTVEYVISEQPTYINWCVSHSNDFELGQEVIVRLNKGKTFSNLSFSDKLLEVLKKIDNPIIKTLLSRTQFITDFEFIDLSNSIDMVDGYKNTKKTQIKFGRFINKLLTENYIKCSQYDVECLVNSFKSHMDSLSYVFEVIKGSNIKDSYDGEYYELGDGTLQSSCMKYKKCRSFLNIYTKNSSISLLVLKSKFSGKVIGRAILWDKMNVIPYNGGAKSVDPIEVKFMDRIYYTKDHQRDLFINYAVENGYAFKTEQNNETFGHIKYKNKVIENPLLYTTLDKHEFELYPYMDTMQCVIENGFISNITPYVISRYFKLKSSELFDIKSKKGNFIDDEKVKYVEARRTDGIRYIRDYTNQHEQF